MSGNKNLKVLFTVFFPFFKVARGGNIWAGWKCGWLDFLWCVEALVSGGGVFFILIFIAVGLKS